MISKDKALSMLGLCARAAKLTSGEFSTEKAVKDGKAYLVIVADDASDNTKKKFKDMCSFYEVPIVMYGDKDSLGHYIGKEFRASVAVTDSGFAESIMSAIQRSKDTEVVKDE